MKDLNSNSSRSENSRYHNTVQASDENARHFDAASHSQNTSSDTLKAGSKLAQNAPKIFYALQGMYKYSALGESLVHWATVNNVQFQQQSALKSSGLYSPLRKTVTTKAQNTLAFNVPILAHELMHAIQDQCYQSLNYKCSWDLRTRLAHTHSFEAAANVCSFQVSHEANENGFTAPWKALLSSRIKGQKTHFSFLAQRYDKAYKHALSLKQPPKAAYKLAGTWCYIHYFRSSNNLQSYAKKTLTEYFNDLNNGKLKHQIVNDFNSRQARNHGKLNDSVSLTSVIKIAVDDKDLFGDNKRLAQAADYIEFFRQVEIQKLIPTDLGYRRMRHELIQNNNPFRNIKRPYLEYIQQQFPNENIYDLMEKLTKVKNLQFKQQLQIKNNR